MAYCRRFCARLWLALSAPRCLRIGVVLLMITLVGVYYNLFFLLTANHLEDPAFVRTDKCPACYGRTLCPEFSQGQLSLASYSRMRFLDAANVKNIFYGWRAERDVVLKRLAHDEELAAFDAELCRDAGVGAGCDVARHIYFTKFARVLAKQSLEPAHVQGLSDLVSCPSERLLERVVAKYKESLGVDVLDEEQKMMLMTMLSVNPEPIIYMIFPYSEGWPFPQYHGACGRLIVEDYGGKILRSYFGASWHQRVDLAHQVMKIAEQLTNNDLEYALYMTDVTFDNFAVNAEGKVLAIDAENIIVVDKRKIRTDAKPAWNLRHQSFHDECKSQPGCLSFSSELLCKRHSSDHNYYATCHGLLAKKAGWLGMTGGLLHDPPADLPEREELASLIAECEKPSQENGRYDAMQRLLQLLAKLTGPRDK